MNWTKVLIKAMPFTDMTSKTYAVHKQTKKGEYYDGHHLQHSQKIIMLTHFPTGKTVKEQIIHVLTLPGTAATVSKPNIKLKSIEKKKGKKKKNVLLFTRQKSTTLKTESFFLHPCIICGGKQPDPNTILSM